MASSPVIPLHRGSARALTSATHRQLVDIFQHYREMGNEWVRRAVIEHNRVDILASYVLGYEVLPFHLQMLQWQLQNPTSLQLVFRGAGKTTICTVTKAIHLLLKDPNLRICIGSKTTGNSEGFLKEIKGHFEQNERLEDIFGPYYDSRKVGKWDNREIEVLPRTRHSKEGSITCVGVDGTIVSKHYDIILSDDIVDEENSRTQYMRDKTRTWYYQTLDPCLEPPDPDVPHRGEHHILGTRYHYDDLYGHLIKNELKKAHNIIPALDEEGNSPWPEKYPPEWFEEKKKKSGIIIFRAQYQCDTEAQKGEIFQYDDCQIIKEENVPSGLRIFIGCDLAISQKKKTADQFAIVVLGKDKADNRYVLEYFTGFLRFHQQMNKFFGLYDKYSPIMAGVEANAYQAAMVDAIKNIDRDVRVCGIITDKDKVTRAWKLTPIFEGKKVFFRENMDIMIDQFVLFPNHKYKDLVDAFDLAERASRRRKRRRRRGSEPGVL